MPLYLLTPLIDMYTNDGAFLGDPSPTPPIAPFHLAPPRRWAANSAGVAYIADIDTPQPRKLVTNNTAAAHIKTPTYAAPIAVCTLQNASETSTGTIGFYATTQDGTDIIITAINNPNNNAATTTIDLTNWSGGGDTDTLRVCLNINDTPATIGAITLHAGVQIDDTISDLATTRTNYDLSIYTPLSEQSILARSLQTRNYQIRLLIPRTHPTLSYLLALRDAERLVIANDNRYLPCAIQDVQSAPVGGALYEIQITLQATTAYGYTPQRYITTVATPITIGYSINGDAPAPAEIRIQITQTHTTPIAIHIPATQEIIRFLPDQTGIWSLHDTGRIYHAPTGATSPLYDRTDTLIQGALPITLGWGQGYIALDYDANWGIPYATIAYCPRYQPESIL